MLKRRISVLLDFYPRYVDDYRSYLRLRGFGDHENDWVFVKRGFLTCWMEAGFHRFWRSWNPGIGYFTFWIYKALGGSRRRDAATIITFLINGIIHNLVGCLLVRRWAITMVVTFLSFGFLTVLSRRLELVVRWSRWPRSLNLMLNVALVLLSFDLGFRVDLLL
jgi:hypothetical protein